MASANLGDADEPHTPDNEDGGGEAEAEGSQTGDETGDEHNFAEQTGDERGSARIRVGDETEWETDDEERNKPRSNSATASESSAAADDAVEVAADRGHNGEVGVETNGREEDCATSQGSAVNLEGVGEDTDSGAEDYNFAATALSINLADDAVELDGPCDFSQASSPEAAERLMTALEEEAEAADRDAHETETQILQFADSTSCPSPRTAQDFLVASTGVGSRLVLRRSGEVERVMAWLSTLSASLAARENRGANGEDEDDALMIENEIVRAAMRWMSLDAVGMSSSRSAPQPLPSERSRLERPAEPVQRVQTLQEIPTTATSGDAATPRFFTAYAYSGEEEETARQVLSALQVLLVAPDDVGDESHGVVESAEGPGNRVEVGGGGGGQMLQTNASADKLLQTQTVQVRQVMAALLMLESVDGQVWVWVWVWVWVGVYVCVCVCVCV